MQTGAVTVRERKKNEREKMALSKKRKVDSENRAFQDEWTEMYLFVLPARSTKPACLICSATVALVKSSNVKRHFQNHHEQFNERYPLESDIRKHKIRDLKAEFWALFSTYTCEAAFSRMNMIKNEYRNRLTDEHLDMCMRMALTPLHPRIKLLTGQTKAHFSH